MAEGIALVDGDRVLMERNTDNPRTHSERLLPGIRAILGAAGLVPEGLDGFAVAAGPGSFTGLRIGLATVSGLALACDRPVIGISTLEAMATWAVRPGDRWICAWVEAGRGEVYSGLFRSGTGTPQPVGAETVATPGAILPQLPPDEPICFVGDGTVRHAGRLDSRPGRHPQDRVVSRHPFLGAVVGGLGAGRLAASPAGDAPLRPNYIRKPDAERNRGDAGKRAD
jgi:tRNA threonylcarbamoyladenosine biosynthesis protein TsaB